MTRMYDQVVEIGDFRLKRDRRRAADGCQHKHLTLDDEGEFVTCDDCKKQVGNYAALRMLVERWALLQDRVDSQRAAIAEAASKTIELRAAQHVEKAWRSKSMVPSCPHCNEAIFPGDGFGNTMVNKELAFRRRTVSRKSAPNTPLFP